ncbi:conserved protein of unknown function [Flavobacterium collinsii]|uniref:Uncharacterized protein n=2 Tax=Flavobacterium collinsii TaxID=1114861 RepID=A0A9W4TIC3_9FLAO|nr:conserved protein of unknown function [Flavobacterium collinsii]
MICMFKPASIACITCWYGEYPWYFPYFLHSCSFNPTIDFYIITDNQEEIKNKSKNVKIVIRILDEIKVLAYKKLGFQINIDTPSKLRDFKPAYGFLFSDIIRKYKFWAFHDIDIVFGSIRTFFPDIILKYDIISSRPQYITGSFCLFRNKEYINRLFMKSKDYKKVFTNPEYFGFEECNFLFEELKRGTSILEIDNPIESMSYIVEKEQKESRIKVYYDFLYIDGISKDIEWNKGVLTYDRFLEIMFYHFKEFKTSCALQSVLRPMPMRYSITKTEILESKAI